MNLLSGKAFIDLGPPDRTQIVRPTQMNALPPLTAWSGNVPKVCTDYLN